MAKRLQYSRWRRLPGLYRFGQRRPADPNVEPQRLTLYLPCGLLDRAEGLARREGAESLQSFCESLLTQALENEMAREHFADVEARTGPLEGLDAIANDPEYLAELTIARDRPAPAEVPAPPPPTWPEPLVSTGEASRAAEVVLRHAGLVADDPAGLLATLRRGEAIGPDAARELLQALIDLEVQLRHTHDLDRRLAYALHRLGFEGQVLLTEAWPGTTADSATVDVLRLVQEAVDRVLSGEDIRYFNQAP